MRKPLLENCQRLRISDVKGAIPGNSTGAVLEVGSQELSIIGRLTNLGNGFRYCFLCPECRRPYESLYSADLGSWQCRRCVGAVYASTRKIRVESGQYENEYRSDY
ncbi:MAG: hypothetical protein Greene041662_1014 [Candidatus Peregrinibacteria bacterium Greene0416_62]|nr:MAG: hypothetical protein Greene041662_1014 [Candidatus Peregrinibacteria bacterium Greene0416_62]